MANLNARQTKDLVDNFLYKIGAKARITSRRQAVYEPPKYNFNNFNSQYLNEIHYRDEFIVEMELPEDAFKRMIEDANDLEELKAHYGPNIMEMGRGVMQRDYESRIESSIRRTNPGVQKAWERYQTMLKLAGG